jgi:flagellar motor component MotA
MGFVDWRSGVWLFLLGLVGVLLPTFGGYATPVGGWGMPVWPFYVLMVVGAALTGIGVYNKLKSRK